MSLIRVLRQNSHSLDITPAPPPKERIPDAEAPLFFVEENGNIPLHCTAASVLWVLLLSVESTRFLSIATVHDATEVRAASERLLLS